jgi:hypothetical protein
MFAASHVSMAVLLEALSESLLCANRDLCNNTPIHTATTSGPLQKLSEVCVAAINKPSKQPTVPSQLLPPLQAGLLLLFCCLGWHTSFCANPSPACIRSVTYSNDQFITATVCISGIYHSK